MCDFANAGSRGAFIHPVIRSIILHFWLAYDHPFIDGNKRTAFASMLTFLSINGYELNASADETWNFVSVLYEKNNFTFENLEPWLRKNSAPG